MEWTRDLESGISVIDAKHKRIVEFIDELLDACQTRNAEETRHVMEGLLNYAVTHFEFEEALPERAGYPFLKARRRIHEIFTKKIAAIRARSAKGEDVAPELPILLKGWLVNHIKGEVRDYVESVKKYTNSDDQEISGWLSPLLTRFTT